MYRTMKFMLIGDMIDFKIIDELEENVFIDGSFVIPRANHSKFLSEFNNLIDKYRI